jgi:hypothetical protein
MWYHRVYVPMSSCDVPEDVNSQRSLKFKLSINSPGLGIVPSILIEEASKRSPSGPFNGSCDAGDQIALHLWWLPK